MTLNITTLRKMLLSIVTPSIVILSFNDNEHKNAQYSDTQYNIFIVVLNVALLDAIMLNVIVPRVVARDLTGKVHPLLQFPKRLSWSREVSLKRKSQYV